MSIDRREDAGDFYPGGKVISTRPVATGGDVKHSEFEDLDVRTNTIPDLRDAVRELGRRLGATVVTALAACVAIAATVQTVPVNDLDFDANPSLVTNVVFDAPPDFSTNNTELVETIEATAPAPGDYATVSNRAMTAVQPGGLSFTNDYIRTSWASDTASEFAGRANGAGYADRASAADWADYASSAGDAIEANHASSADWATYADRAGISDFSDYAEKIQFGANLSDAKTGEEMLALNKNYTDNATNNLARVAHTGSYNDLSNKPTIPTVPTSMAWDAITGKPTTISGYGITDALSADDLSSAISATNTAFSNAVLSVGLNIDTNTVAQINALVEHGEEIPVGSAATVGGLLLALAAAVAALKRDKANKVANATAGNLATLTAQGNLADAGYHFEVRGGIPCIVQYT